MYSINQLSERFKDITQEELLVMGYIQMEGGKAAYNYACQILGSDNIRLALKNEYIQDNNMGMIYLSTLGKLMLIYSQMPKLPSM